MAADSSVTDWAMLLSGANPGSPLRSGTLMMAVKSQTQYASLAI